MRNKLSVSFLKKNNILGHLQLQNNTGQFFHLLNISFEFPLVEKSSHLDNWLCWVFKTI